MQVGLASGALLARMWLILALSWEASWSQVGLIGGIILSYLTLSHRILPYLILSYLTLVILDILATTVLPRANLWGQQVSLGNTSKGKYSPLILCSYFVFHVLYVLEGSVLFLFVCVPHF